MDRSTSTALHEAAASGHEATIRLLLERGANIETRDYRGITALHTAAAFGHEATTRLLLDYGAICERVMLDDAITKGQETVVNLLSDRLANTKVRG
jgi:ankyrin repeat protein